ncbi:MAG: beta-galactosidase [Paludibaculum sp.]
MKQIAILLASLSLALAQPPKMPTVLYGAAYYHEYMPSDRLDKDIEMMKQAGLTVVRLGESTWTSWEPKEGQFEFAWMDRILDALHKAGIKVIMGTPTYSIPPWLHAKHPEIMAVHMDGSKSTYGIRQNMDISHPTYRFYCERVIRQIMAHYKDHPSIIGYQVDNETSYYQSAGPVVQKGFVDYLKKKFGSTQELNKVWGLVYWGQLVQGWDELPPRNGILNPGYKVEFERYQRTRVTDFLDWQARIVNEYKRPGQFVTQDFSGGVHTDIDQWAIARSLDIAATNPYYSVQDDLDFQTATLTDDVARSVKDANFLVTETNAQTIGWDSKGQFPPYDGQLRMNVYGHLADGANMVEYWHWHSLHYGQETYWKGVLSHDLQPNRIYKEFSQVGHELQKIGPKLVGGSEEEAGRGDPLLRRLVSRDQVHAVLGQARLYVRVAADAPDAVPPKRGSGLHHARNKRPAALQGDPGGAAVVCRFRYRTQPSGGIRQERRALFVDLQERIHRRVRHGPAGDGAGSATGGGGFPLPGVLLAEAAAGAEGRPVQGRRAEPGVHLGRDDRVGHGEGAGGLRSSVLRPLSGHHAQRVRPRFGDV